MAEKVLLSYILLFLVLLSVSVHSMPFKWLIESPVPAESEEENKENLNNNDDDVKRALAAIMSLQGNGADDDVITRKRGSSSELYRCGLRVCYLGETNGNRHGWKQQQRYGRRVNTSHDVTLINRFVTSRFERYHHHITYIGSIILFIFWWNWSLFFQKNEDLYLSISIYVCCF